MNNLDTKIAAKGHIVGFLREEIAGGGSGGGTMEHHLALLGVKIGGQRREIEFGEERPLQHRVDAMDST